MWPFKKPEPVNNDPLGMIAHYEGMFGEGSWAELEKDVMGRLQKRDPYLYNLIKNGD
jgi:hypothetical protein